MQGGNMKICRGSFRNTVCSGCQLLISLTVVKVEMDIYGILKNSDVYLTRYALLWTTHRNNVGKHSLM